MKLIDRYIGLTVMSATLVVVLVLLGLEMFIEFVNELGDIGTGGYGVLESLVYVPLQLPNDIYQLFPVAALIGSLIGLGRLASSSELIVMRAAGVSKAQITWAVIKAMIILLIIFTLIGEVLAPKAKSFAQNYKAKAETGMATAPLRQGIWVRDGENYIHINDVLPQAQLRGITRYKFNDNQLELASFAQSGSLQNGQWIFNDVNESQIGSNAVSSKHYAQQNWGVSFDPDLLGVANIRTDQASLWNVYRYIRYLKINGLLTTQYEFALYKRLLQPFATIVMICLAVPFIFGALRSVTMGLRILIGVIVGFGFYTLDQFFGPFSLVYQISPFWAAATPVIVFALIDAVLLWRVR